MLEKIRAVGDRFLRLGEAGLTANEASRVRAVRLTAVLGNTPWMMSANIGNTLVTMAAFWNTPGFSHIAICGTLIILLALVTGNTWWRNRTKPQRLRASIRGTKQALFYVASLAAIWAVMIASVYPVANEYQKLVIIAITVGMMAGGSVAMATIPPAVITFGTLMGLGALLALLQEPHITSLYLIALFAIYLAILIKTSLQICKGLTERAKAQMAASEQRDVIGLLLNDFEENASDWLWGVDRNLNFVRASPRFFELTGKTPQEVIGGPFWQSLPMRDSPCKSILANDGRQNLQQLMNAQEAFRDVALCVTQDGEPRVWSLSAKPITDECGAFNGYRGVGRDITAARQARRRIEHMARHDPLTDIGNRTLLAEELEVALQHMRRFDHGFSILLLDLDRFKQVNDTHGHGAGDELLKAVAARLSTMIDKERDTVARLGGDEFVIIHTTMKTARNSSELAERIIAALSAPFPLAGGSARIGVSIGIAYAPIDGTDADGLMRNADLALYRAKSDGRNRYRFFDSSLDAAARRRNLIETELREAIASEGLTLNYQPLVDAVSGRVVCFEALLRWDHPRLGPISPMEFVPIAEDAGIISDIGAWVIRQACRTAGTWPEQIRVAVNFSPRQFTSPGLFASIKAALAESRFPPERLEVEVTESVLLNTPEAVEATLQALRALGVRIALDDFGTGYSSLSYLRQYRFDKLKIDQSFIRDIEHKTESRAIVEAIIRLGRDLDISLVAEGVETPGQLSLLQALGCGEIQGYLIGMPTPKERLSTFFNAAFEPDLDGRRTA